ncbi:helix-turn-helix domain-containing protein [Mesorhizobium sp. M2A.F.Ca.ET.037.01.1.1]|uniref:AraC family transcriptional regulator n=1 Tax=unclassified Mesorhizobium TaxID=325217 RepID=UPI000F76440E|nr:MULTISPECIES: AraC family transcriptional regulator [unclassified Mesorhizobium]RVC70138.1 helix-turn-helix domain-containing protein [Mesorhizobium sp. M2A.F.Ca.ET.046.02.1.1]RVC70645.1 helix-turn-helix domain-containing protein [Mesorhizobium sp. M00.F.Ca.ET.038.03.1.1]AZO37009.1 AraC family transcriptional regulator [Mesorhizobium sp. M2A.F.Ca.ET.046.03.2.1]RUX08136.1 helix-turn-helix domain-containing protein [Mesorhizobium sp. M2A.F.Ca.ET.037.01.1.1]RWA92130.1 MAG: helix-turn-helix dom
MSDILQELVAMAGRHARGRRTKTAIPRVTIGRSELPTPPLPELCQPTALLVLQGTKTVLIGDRTLAYSAGSYFVYAVEAPATSQLIEASRACPYMALAFAIDIELIAGLLIDHRPAIDGDSFVTNPADDDLLDAWRRLLRLLDRPEEIPVLAPMLEREIAFRLLQGPQGEKLRQLARADGRLSQIRRATAWIRSHYNEPIDVTQLAELSHMSNAAFHRHFKAATAMSPIQYQKQLRLLEARHLLIAQPGSAAQVAFTVGYESASQFSREYARQFGLPPARDAARLLAMGEAAALEID